MSGVLCHYKGMSLGSLMNLVLMTIDCEFDLDNFDYVKLILLVYLSLFGGEGSKSPSGCVSIALTIAAHH